MARLKRNAYKRRWDNSTRRWVYLHREVVEGSIGRPLTEDEHVHHINGDHRDNRLENLQVLSCAEHAHISKNRRSLTPFCTVEACDEKHHARGLCRKHYRLANPERWYGKR